MIKFLFISLISINCVFAFDDESCLKVIFPPLLKRGRPIWLPERSSYDK